MDVRCEQCGTEYELDDASVPDGGCPVQCTECGHTFTVHKPGSAAVAAQAERTPPPPAEWLLETSAGNLHRFRNLTSLQKWIIERKVTREDKISRTGHAWRALGDIVELEAFFDVVDEADRARAAGAAPVAPALHTRASGPSAKPSAKPSSGTQVGTQGESGAGLPGYSDTVVDSPRAPEADSEPVTQVALAPQVPTSELQSPVVEPSSAEATSRVHDLDFVDEVDVDLVPAGRRRGWLVLLVLLGVAAGAGVVYWLKLQGLGPFAGAARGAQETAGVHEQAGADAGSSAPYAGPLENNRDRREHPGPSSGPTNKQAAPGTAGIKTSGQAASAGTNTAPEHPITTASAPSTGTPKATGSSSRSTGSNPVAQNPPEQNVPQPNQAAPKPGRRSAASATNSAESTTTIRPEKLLASADRLLENGATSRAAKLYNQVLAVRPQDAAALAGVGYVMMDRGRTRTALAYFKAALKSQPLNGPALFGLGEASREVDDYRGAISAYKRYIAANPQGRYRMAAQRYVGLLEARLGSPRR